MEDRRNVGENICNSGDGTDQTGPILDVYDDDDDDDIRKVLPQAPPTPPQTRYLGVIAFLC